MRGTCACCIPAPPVIGVDPDGNVVQAWGGPGAGYQWPGNEHGIRIDPKGNVWVAGNGNQDGLVYVCDRMNARIQVFRKRPASRNVPLGPQYCRRCQWQCHCTSPAI